MKPILTLLICLSSITTFSQTKTENKKGTTGLATGDQKGNRQETPKAINYESRTYQNECYKNFDFTVKNYGYNKDGNFYSWGVSVKNNYTQPIQLKYKLIVGNDNTQYGTLTTFIEPKATYSNDFGLAKAIIVNNDSDQFMIEVSDVCFKGDDCYKNGYVDCNGKQNQNFNSEKSDKNHVKTTVETDDRKEFFINTDINYDVSFRDALLYMQSLGYQLISQENTQTSIKYNFNEFVVYVWSSTGGIKRGFKVERYMTAMNIVCENNNVLNDLLSKIKCDSANTSNKCISFSNPDTKQYGININRK